MLAGQVIRDIFRQNRFFILRKGSYGRQLYSFSSADVFHFHMADKLHHLLFGLIADVQYADHDDGSNFALTRKRYYRAALHSLKRAVAAWKSRDDLAFVLQLGDLLDGINRRKCGEAAVSVALETVLAPFRELDCATYHMVGNHDLYNLTRNNLLTSPLNSALLAESVGEEGELFYSVTVHEGLRLVALDTYDVGVLGYDDQPTHPHYLEAVKILDQNNPNAEKNSAIGVHGVGRRFVAYNGGIGNEQLVWLDRQLTDADAHRQNVLICAHCQLHPSLNDTSDAGTCLVWNYQEVLNVLHAHDCVIGCVMGHDHDGSLTTDTARIPHLVLNGVIETPPGTDAYATAFLRDHTLDIEGAGVVPSISLPLKYPISAESSSVVNDGVEVLPVA